MLAQSIEDLQKRRQQLNEEMHRLSLGVALSRWSRAFWTSMNGVVFSESPGPVEAQARLMVALAKVLPCGVCRAHMDVYLRDHNPAIDCKTNEDMGDWLFDFHNDVNKRTHGRQLLRHELPETLPTPVGFVRELWGMVLAVAFMYPGRTAEPQYFAFVTSLCDSLPDPARDVYTAHLLAASGSEHMTNAADWVRQLVNARNELVPEEVEPTLTYENAVGDFVEPRGYKSFGITDEDTVARLTFDFDVRMSKSRNVLKRIHEVDTAIAGPSPATPAARTAPTAGNKDALNSQPSGSSGLSNGAIVGIIIGVFVVLALIVVAFTFWTKWQRGKAQERKQTKADPKKRLGAFDVLVGDDLR